MSEAMLHKKSTKVRPHFFAVKRRERDEALKRKSCLSEASSFSLAESPTGVGKKVQTANFLCFVSFVRAKEMKSLRGLSESKAFKPLWRLSKKPKRQLSEKQQNASRRMKKFVKAHNEILQDPQCYASRRINQVFNVCQHKKNILPQGRTFFQIKIHYLWKNTFANLWERNCCTPSDVMKKGK